MISNTDTVPTLTESNVCVFSYNVHERVIIYLLIPRLPSAKTDGK